MKKKEQSLFLGVIGTTLLTEQDSHVLYMMDITKYAKIEEAYDDSQVVIGDFLG